MNATMGMLLEPTPEFWARCGTMSQGWPGEGQGAVYAHFVANPLNTARGIECVPGERGCFREIRAAEGA